MTSAAARWQRWSLRISASLADQGIVAAAHFGLQVVLARLLPPAAYGTFAVAHAVLLFLMGAHAALLAEPMSVLGPAHHGDDLPGYLRASWRLQLWFSAAVAAGAACAGLAAWPFSPPVARALGGLAAAAPLYLGYQFLRRACYVLGRPRQALQGSVAYAVVLAAALALLVRTGRLTAVTGLLALAAAGVAGAGVLLLRARLSPPADGLTGSVLWRQSFRYGRWIFAANVAHWAGSGAFLFFLGVLAGLSEAGAFRALQNLITPAQQVLAALGLLLLPWLAAGRAPAGRTPRWLAAWGVGAGFSLVYALLLWAFGPWLVDLLYGAGRYSGEASLLPLFILYLLLVGGTHGLAVALRAAERPRPIFVSKLAAGGVALTLGLALTAWAGLRGALWGLVSSAAAELVVVGLAMRTEARR